MRRTLALALASVMIAASSPAGPDRRPPPPADPLKASIDFADADRFVRLFEASGGTPTADALQRGYLDPGSYGVHVFTNGRIESAAHLSATVAANTAAYRRAIADCLPVARAANADLRAIYLALKGLLPDKPLPQIYMMFGAGNSGGTAGPGAQVLGIEVLCAIAPQPAAFRQQLRQFFAHETVHTWQPEYQTQSDRAPLLRAILTEGAADFIASMVTGEDPKPARSAWAAPREQALWTQLRADLTLVAAKSARDPAARAASNRWVSNYGTAPDGWPYEAGYWMGMRIWSAYYARATDKHRAIRAMLTIEDPEALLAASGYTPAPGAKTALPGM